MDTDIENDFRTGVFNEEKVGGGYGPRPVKKHFTAFDACIWATCLLVFVPSVYGADILPTSVELVTVSGILQLECDGGDRWFHDGCEGREEIHDGGRYEVNQSALSTLTVSNAIMDDAGMYACCDIKDKHETCFPHRVVVLPKPPCKPFEVPAGMWADNNSTHYQVGCQNNNVWNMTCIRDEWTGEYGHCSLGSNISCTCSLRPRLQGFRNASHPRVYDQTRSIPDVYILPTSDKTVTVDGILQLECNGGDRWFHDGCEGREEIHDGGRYEVNQSALSTLTVINAAFDDAGIYACCDIKDKEETCFKHRVVVLPRPPCKPFEVPPGMWTDTKSTHFQVGCKYNGDEWNLTCISGEWKPKYGLCPLERPPCKNETMTGECRPSPHEDTKYKAGFIVVMILLGLIIVGLIIKCLIKSLKRYQRRSGSDLSMKKIGNRQENAEENASEQEVLVTVDYSTRSDLPEKDNFRNGISMDNTLIV